MYNIHTCFPIIANNDVSNVFSMFEVSEFNSMK